MEGVDKPMNEWHGTACVTCGIRLCTTEFSEDGKVHCDCELSQDSAEYSDGSWYCGTCADVMFPV